MKSWEKGSFWYFQALNSPKGLYRIFNEHIQPRFCAEHSNMTLFDEIVAPYWSTDAARVIEAKIEEERGYKARLRKEFGADVG